MLLRQLFSERSTDDSLADLATAFFAGAHDLIETPWRLAAVPDFVMPETEGEAPPDFENQLSFGSALTQLAAEDPEVQKLVTEVRHLTRPGSELRTPDLVMRVRALMPFG